MHTVVQLASFDTAAKRCLFGEKGISKLITFLAENPEAGDEIKGSGGCRKIRLAGRGRGKSGGFRIVTFYSGASIPVFLLTMYAKGERADLIQDEIKKLHGMTKQLVAAFRPRAIRKSDDT